MIDFKTLAREALAQNMDLADAEMERALREAAAASLEDLAGDYDWIWEF